MSYSLRLTAVGRLGLYELHPIVVSSLSFLCISPDMITHIPIAVFSRRSSALLCSKSRSLAAGSTLSHFQRGFATSKAVYKSAIVTGAGQGMYVSPKLTPERLIIYVPVRFEVGKRLRCVWPVMDLIFALTISRVIPRTLKMYASFRHRYPRANVPNHILRSSMRSRI